MPVLRIDSLVSRGGENNTAHDQRDYIRSYPTNLDLQDFAAQCDFPSEIPYFRFAAVLMFSFWVIMYHSFMRK